MKRSESIKSLVDRCVDWMDSNIGKMMLSTCARTGHNVSTSAEADGVRVTITIEQVRAKPASHVRVVK